jgi:hypothetical protein
MIGCMEHLLSRQRSAAFPDAGGAISPPDAEMLAWFEVDRIAMRHVFEDAERLDQVPFNYRTWSTPWERWMSPSLSSDSSWRRWWAHAVALARRLPLSSNIGDKVLAR